MRILEATLIRISRTPANDKSHSILDKTPTIPQKMHTSNHPIFSESPVTAPRCLLN
ncbi:hypothetical protein Scep_021811 [Stephania cephalantha]|uniref:Uncharacterized protein n=1 Tax=Stephania cephalantha TaxID=152367 RepID=A0AAP0I0I4_9MAGN